MAIFAVNVLTASNFVDTMAAALDQRQTCQIGDLLFYLGGASTDWIVTRVARLMIRFVVVTRAKCKVLTLAFLPFFSSSSSSFRFEVGGVVEKI